jgi:hypothetical protein
MNVVFAAPFGALKIKSSGSLGGNSASALVQRLRTPGLSCRFGPDLSGLRVRQGAQPTCVGHRVPVSVVVEVSEDAKVLSVPLADAVGPPIQIGVAVRASVEVIMVRAVEPHVNRRQAHPRIGRSCRTSVRTLPPETSRRRARPDRTVPDPCGSRRSGRIEALPERTAWWSTCRGANSNTRRIAATTGDRPITDPCTEWSPSGSLQKCCYCPTRPSMHSRRRSACPQCRAYSSIR